MTERLLGIADIADLLGVCNRQVRRLRLDELIPEPMYIGRLPRWKSSTIEAWIEAGCPDAAEFAAREAAKAVRQ